MTAAPQLLAIIELSFDPLLRIGELIIRWQTLGVLAALLAGIALASKLAVDDAVEPRLRIGDMALLLAAAVPGAVLGGRLIHAIAFWDAYSANPLRLFDPSVGALSLLGAIGGGLVTAGYAAHVTGAPVRRWADAAAVPLLLAIGIGKLAQLLGGSGQGLPFAAPWAVAFTGDGPWVSASAHVPSHPSQIYEGLWALLGIPLVLSLARSRRLSGHRVESGWLLAAALAWFLLGRVLVGFTWRDQPTIGPLNSEQALALVALVTVPLALRLGRPHHGVGDGGAISAALTALLITAIAAFPAAAPARAGTALTIDERLAAMTLQQKVGQLFMVMFYGDQAAETNVAQRALNTAALGVPTATEVISRYNVGGIIYFDERGNLKTPRQIGQLSNALQRTAVANGGGIPLLISADQEGGQVARLPAPATRFPGNMALGATRGLGLARSTARSIGRELRSVGINQNLAPVAGVNVDPLNPIIGVRSFGSSSALVAQMVGPSVRGTQIDAGIAATAKHFPGHGDTAVDSHTGLPVIDHSLADWRTIDAPPFAAAVGAGVKVVMTGHLAVPALDASGTPATLSGPILGDYLRSELGFEGVVMTDALDMGALRLTYADAEVPVLALLAGVDLLLMPPSLPVAFEAVLAAVDDGRITVERLDQSVRRILLLKESLGLFANPLVRLRDIPSSYGIATHRAVERKVAERSVTLLVNDAGLLPLSAPRGASFLLVGPSAATLAPLETLLRARGYASSTLAVGDRPTAEGVAGGRGHGRRQRLRGGTDKERRHGRRAATSRGRAGDERPATHHHFRCASI